jgi:hypothetical protein
MVVRPKSAIRDGICYLAAAPGGCIMLPGGPPFLTSDAIRLLV